MTNSNQAIAGALKQWATHAAESDGDNLKLVALLRWAYDNGPTTHHLPDCKIPQVLKIRQIIGEK